MQGAQVQSLVGELIFTHAVPAKQKKERKRGKEEGRKERKNEAETSNSSRELLRGDDS